MCNLWTLYYHNTSLKHVAHYVERFTLLYSTGPVECISIHLSVELSNFRNVAIARMNTYTSVRVSHPLQRKERYRKISFANYTVHKRPALIFVLRYTKLQRRLAALH